MGAASLAAPPSDKRGVVLKFDSLMRQMVETIAEFITKGQICTPRIDRKRTRARASLARPSKRRPSVADGVPLDRARAFWRLDVKSSSLSLSLLSLSSFVRLLRAARRLFVGDRSVPFFGEARRDERVVISSSLSLSLNFALDFEPLFPRRLLDDLF